MAIVKRLADYATSGGSGGYGVEGYRGASMQDVNRALNSMHRATPGGTGSFDMANQVKASNEINKLLGIQAVPGAMGVPSGIGKPGIGNMNVVTPSIAKKTQEWFDSKEKKDLDNEKRELAKLQSIGEIYNSMLKSASDNPLTLKALKESEDFQKIEKSMREQLEIVFGTRPQGSFVDVKGDVKKAPPEGSTVYHADSGEAGLKVLDTIIRNDGVYLKVKNAKGEERYDKLENFTTKKPKRTPPKQTGGPFDFNER